MLLTSKRLVRSILALQRRFPFQYHAGLNVWNEELTTELKLRIESHWGDAVRGCGAADEAPGAGAEAGAEERPYYALAMIPYPSGRLHMGHVRVYAASDALARFRRLRGRRVLHPMGWDAFGLPAENAALERGLSAAAWTEANVAAMRAQLDRLGCRFDWRREIATCRPDYYRWTQRLFLLLHERGLVYKKEAYVNWDPIDKTVLADEQVDAEGRSWRSGAKVEKKILHQWFIRTTAFAERLLDGLSDPALEQWGDIIDMQRNWIGECDGVAVDFPVALDEYSTTLRVWTDRPERLAYGAFVAVPPSAPLDRERLVASVGDGFKLLAATARDPVACVDLPVFVTADLPYAEGAECYLGAPALCAADAEFALRVGLPATASVELSTAEAAAAGDRARAAAAAAGAGGHRVGSKLRDWLISRQRHWGTPIPFVECAACGDVPVPLARLPVPLPPPDAPDAAFATACPRCGGAARRVRDTMDTFVDSSWYYLRFLDPRNEREPFSAEAARAGMPVDLYVGGKEHAVLHLYYARFVCHFLESAGLVASREPFRRLLVLGVVAGKSYRSRATGRYLSPSEAIDCGDSDARCAATGERLAVQWEKMSKSKRNGVDPEEVRQRFGCDTMRLLILADFAPTSARRWSDSTFPGILNWQKKLWLTVREFIAARNDFDDEERRSFSNNEKYVKIEESMREARNHFVLNATSSLVHFQQFSGTITRMQSFTRTLRKAPRAQMAHGAQFERGLVALVVALAPFAPHFASELWAGVRSAPHRLAPDAARADAPRWHADALQQRWPDVDADHRLDLICKVNGKEVCRTKLSLGEMSALAVDAAVALALARREVRAPLAGRRFRPVLDKIPDNNALLRLDTISDDRPPTPPRDADVQRPA